MFKGIIKILGAYVIAATMVATPIISHILHEEVYVETVEPTPIPAVETVVEEIPAKVYASTPVDKAMRIMDEVKVAMVEVEETEEIEEVEVVEVVEEKLPLTQEEIELIALITMAEAEGESEEGKRLVIDTILNRVDSELSYFPDTVKGVIYQENQFSCLSDGRIDKCYVSEDICELVKDELRNRTNSEVLWFRAGYFCKYGEPLLVEGNHYFSKHA